MTYLAVIALLTSALRPSDNGLRTSSDRPRPQYEDGPLAFAPWKAAAAFYTVVQNLACHQLIKLLNMAFKNLLYLAIESHMKRLPNQLQIQGISLRTAFVAISHIDIWICQIFATFWQCFTKTQFNQIKKGPQKMSILFWLASQSAFYP